MWDPTPTGGMKVLGVAAGLAGGMFKRLGSVLAKKGLVRGTAGRLLGGGAMGAGAMAGAEALPRFAPGVGMVLRGGAVGAVVRGGGALIARRWPAKILKLIAAGLAFEVGGRIIDAITGKDITPTRRMNYANGRALKRAIRRFDGASKQYAKVLKATSGKKCGRFTITAKRPKRKCA